MSSQGQELYAQAEAKLKSKGFLSNIFGSSSHFEKAAELFELAGNNYKVGQDWQGAGKSFSQCGTVHLNQGNKFEAAQKFNEAANCYRKCDVEKASTFLGKAIEIYTELGRFTIAAKLHLTLAEIYESSTGSAANIPNAIVHYRKASDYYRGEEATSSANKCLLKVAELSSGFNQEYKAAAEIYEDVAQSSLNNKLLRHAANEYFFRATLCHLNVDILNGQQALAKYSAASPSFSGSREETFLKSIANSLEEQNLEEFVSTVSSYDSVSRLDSWTTSLLLKLKKTLSEEEDLC